MGNLAALNHLRQTFFGLSVLQVVAPNCVEVWRIWVPSKEKVRNEKYKDCVSEHRIITHVFFVLAGLPIEADPAKENIDEIC